MCIHYLLIGVYTKVKAKDRFFMQYIKMSVNLCLCIYVNMHICTHIHQHNAYIWHAHMFNRQLLISCTCKCSYAHMYTCICTHKCMYIHVETYMCFTQIHIHVYMYKNIHIGCIWRMYKNIHIGCIWRMIIHIIYTFTIISICISIHIDVFTFKCTHTCTCT